MLFFLNKIYVYHARLACSHACQSEKERAYPQWVQYKKIAIKKGQQSIIVKGSTLSLNEFVNEEKTGSEPISLGGEGKTP